MSDINITINGTKRLLTAGKYCDKNIVITPVGGGDFSGEYVIPVDELPTENIDENAVYLCKGAYYKYAKEFVTVVNDGSDFRALADLFEITVSFNIVPTKPTTPDEANVAFYYVEDEDEFYTSEDGGELATMASALGKEVIVVENIADASSTGLYAVMQNGWTKYLAPTGTLEITESGTYNVSEYASAEVNVQGGDVQEYDGTITIS